MIWNDFSAAEGIAIERADGERLRSLSASSISRLLTCPEQFRQSYILGRWPPANGNTVLGNAYHSARQTNYEQKIYSGHDLPWKEVGDAYHAGWKKAASEEVVWRDADQNELYWLGFEMSRLYHVHVSPNVQPVAVEEWFELEVPGVPVPVRGKIDVRDAGAMIDTKTDAKGAKQPQPGWRPQAYIYCAARPGYDFEWHVHSKGGKLLIWTPQSPGAAGLHFANTRARRTAAETMVRHAWQLLVHLYTSYGIDDVWPGNGLVHGFACKFCFYKSKCAYWV